MIAYKYDKFSRMAMLNFNKSYDECHKPFAIIDVREDKTTTIHLLPHSMGEETQISESI